MGTRGSGWYLVAIIVSLALVAVGIYQGVTGH